MAEILKDKFYKKYKFPRGVLPKFMVYLFGPLQGFSWKFLKLNLGIPFEFDNSYSQLDLGIEYRSLSETFIDHVDQLDRDGLI